MNKDEQTLKKVSLEDLSNDDVLTLYNILFSGITISARLARNVVSLQSFVVRMVKERKIVTNKA